MSATQRDRLQQLKLVFGGREVRHPNIIVLRISNAGREEIRADDFTRPITIVFKRSKLLTRDVINQSSQDMDLTLKVDTSLPDEVTVNPLLLNAGEWIEIQFVTDGPVEKPPVRARIAGQTKEPASMAVVQNRRTRRYLVGAWFLCLITGGVSFSFVISESPGIGGLAATGGSIMLAVLIGFVVSAFDIAIRFRGLPRIWRRRCPQPPAPNSR